MVREHFPTLPLVFATHSWFIPVEDPIAELGAGAYVAYNELTRRRLAAHTATAGAEVVRLTQPVAISFADRARDPIRAVPRRAVAVSRKMETVTDRLAAACARLGIDYRQVGGEGAESPDPRPDMLSADIVFAVGRTAVEAMAAARAVFVVDEYTVGGWVDLASYADLEADGFTGLGVGEIAADAAAPVADLEELLGRYDQDLGGQSRRLVSRHHAAQHHAATLVELYASVADAPAGDVSADTLRLLVQDRLDLESRAVRAEWDLARLHNAVEDLQAELEVRNQQREHLLARVARLRDRLLRARLRARRFRRQRDRARAAQPRRRWRRGDAVRKARVP
jgi:hypothetical protein